MIGFKYFICDCNAVDCEHNILGAFVNSTKEWVKISITFDDDCEKIVLLDKESWEKFKNHIDHEFK